MSRTLWNEGRVVGLSAYEIYVRHLYSADPTATPATEAEWLASTVAYGSSMLLLVSEEADTVSGFHYVDYPFPSGCRLCAANNILAGWFNGSGAYPNNSWATRVGSYGALAANVIDDHPPATATSASDIGVILDGDMSADTKASLREYGKVVDGVILQPGSWSQITYTPPYTDLSPDLSAVPTLRLSFSDRITHDFWILLTGFTDKGVIIGTTNVNGSTTSLGTDFDGTFMGPARFPWAAKVMFSVPPALVSELGGGNSSYTRKLPSTESAVTVDTSTVVDMTADPPEVFYNAAAANYGDSRVSIDVTDITPATKAMSVLVTYSTTSGLPTALYGTSLSVNETGANYIVPIDCVAPGAVGIYDSTTLAEARDDIPHNIGMTRDASLILYQIDKSVTDVTDPNRYVPVSNDQTIDLAGLYRYNTRYIWPYRLHSGGGSPDTSDLEDVKSVCCLYAMSGYVSQSFINSYCVDYDTALAAAANIGTGGGKNQAVTPVQLARKIGEQNVRDNYLFFFLSWGGQSYFADTTQYGMFCPVNKNTHKVEALNSYEATAGVRLGINFSGASIVDPNTGETVPSSDTDLMGGYWNITYQTDMSQPEATTVSVSKSGSGYVFEDHPIMYLAMKQYTTSQRGYTAAPQAPDGYNLDFADWFAATKVTDHLSTTTLNRMNVHSYYRQLSMENFLQYMAMEVDMSQLPSEVASSAVITHNQYIFSKTDITALASGSWDWTGQQVNAALLVKSTTSKANYYKPTPMYFYGLTWSGTTYTVGDDVTEQLSDATYHQWASVGQSGKQSTTSISLVDNMGGLLPTTGTSEVVSKDNINWEDLLNALNKNQTIDILGEVLTGMKSNITKTGPNFIQFSNGLRFYIAGSAPTDTDIPTGSIGIGW